MNRRTHLSEVVGLIVYGLNQPVPITKLMKLLYLADVEHVKTHGTTVSGAKWAWCDYGPFCAQCYTAIRELVEQGLVIEKTPGDYRLIAPTIENDDLPDWTLDASQLLSIARTLERFGRKPIQYW
jgi:uncharacterized phage-associated protein